MKIDIISDVHIEINKLNMDIFSAGDLLILAGDITSARIIKDQINFFEDISERYRDVIYICGNHESYGFDITKTYSHIKETLFKNKNIHVLDNEFIKLDNILFYGGTLWTDFDKNPIIQYTARSLLNDFRHIKCGALKLMPEDLISRHRMFLENLNSIDDDVFVISHHAPTHQVIDERFKHDIELNCCFCSELDHLFLKPNIKYWVHGHLHKRHDVVIESTRIICNAYGYDKYESDLTKLFKIKTIEI